MSESKLHLFFPDEKIKKGMQWKLRKMKITKKVEITEDEEESDNTFQKGKFSRLLQILDYDFSIRFSSSRMSKREVIGVVSHVYLEITFLSKVKQNTPIFNIYNLIPVEQDDYLNKWTCSLTVDEYKKLRQDLQLYAETPGTGKPEGYQKVLSIISSFRLVIDDDRFNPEYDYLAEDDVEVLLYKNADIKDVEKILNSCTRSTYTINNNKISISSENLLPEQLEKFAQLTDSVKRINSQHYTFSITPDREIKRLKTEFEIGLLKTGITVCIVDSGVEDNEVFRSLLERNPSFNCSLIGENYFEDMYKKKFGHGTEVASIVIFGDQVAQNIKGKPLIPYARVCSLQMCTDKKPPTSVGFKDIVRCMEKIFDASNGEIRFFNLSIGAQVLKDNALASEFAFLIDVLSHKKDIIPIISAGNLDRSFMEANKHPQYWLTEDTNILAPSDCINGISVGSLKNDDFIAEYSRKDNFDTSHLSSGKRKHRRKPDLVTFGGDSGKNNFKCIDSEGEIISKSGTSFAAPYITHLLVLLASTYPDLGPDALKAVLLNNVICCSEETDKFYLKNLGANNFVNRLYGFGKITSENVDNIISSNNDEATLIIEAKMDFSNYTKSTFPVMTTTIVMPEFVKKYRAKNIHIDATLCYRPNVLKTDTVKDYNPCHLSFKLHSGEDVINSNLTKLKGEPWSQPEILTNAWSNVQRLTTKISRDKLKELTTKGLQVTIRGRLKKHEDIIKYYKQNPQKFAIIISFRDKAKEGILYEELKSKNNLTVQVKASTKAKIQV